MTIVRLKTEWCNQTLNGMECVHPKCFFAHCEDELATLGDRQKVGKIDLRTFKRCPCLTLVSTGACPFRNRCTDIHDVRVSNHRITAWLKHYERNNLSQNGIEFSSHIDTAKAVQQSIQQYEHPYGSDCSLMDSYEAFDAHVLNSYHEDSMRHIRFNSYLDATPMSPYEKAKFLKEIKPLATVRKFEPKHSLHLLGRGKTIRVMLLASHQVPKCDDYILEVIFKATAGIFPTYQRAVLLGHEYDPASGTIASNGYGRAFYIYDHPDQDVHKLMVDVLDADRKHMNFETRRKAFQQRFESILRHFKHFSDQMPIAPENQKEIRDVVYAPTEKSGTRVSQIWKSFVENICVSNHAETLLTNDSPVPILSKLRNGLTIETSNHKIPQLNSKEENHLDEVLDFEGWQIAMKVYTAT